MGRIIQHEFIQNGDHEVGNKNFSTCPHFIEHIRSTQSKLSEKVLDRLRKLAAEIYNTTTEMVPRIKDPSRQVGPDSEPGLANDAQEESETTTIWLHELSLMIDHSIEEKVKKYIKSVSTNYRKILQHLEQIGTGQQVNKIELENPDIQKQYDELIQLIGLYFPFTHVPNDNDNAKTDTGIPTHRAIAALTTRADLIGFSYDTKDEETKEFILELSKKIRKNILSAAGIDSDILRLFDLMAKSKVKLTVIEIKTKYDEKNNQTPPKDQENTLDAPNVDNPNYGSIEIDQEDIRDIAHTLFAVFEFFVIQTEKGKSSSESKDNKISDSNGPVTTADNVSSETKDNQTADSISLKNQDNQTASNISSKSKDNNTQETDPNRRSSIRNIFSEVSKDETNTQTTRPKTRLRTLLENREFLRTLRGSTVPILVTVNIPPDILKKIKDGENIKDADIDHLISQITLSCQRLEYNHELRKGIKAAMRRAA
ncbi:MAG: hypothetical protein N3A71_02205 [Candidatus Dojkabacteria bacterium]|nr:hypothetical protein [Candidatus Dojkabacteria bacterium]